MLFVHRLGKSETHIRGKSGTILFGRCKESTIGMAYEKTTIIGTSTEGFTEATDDAIEEAQERYENIKWAETSLRGVELAGGNREYQVEAVIAYAVNE